MIPLKKSVFFIFLILAALFNACSAPRNNPLDAQNPNRELSEIRGRVFTLRLPHRPVSDVQVLFLQDKRATLSGPDGMFEFKNVIRYNGYLHFFKPGYHPDSLYLRWDNQTTWHGETYLNALPHLDSLIFYSSLTNRYPDIQILELFVKVRITDSDKDIDSVLFKSATLGFSTVLTYNSVNRFFERLHISMSALHVHAAEEIIGHPFQIIVKDAFLHSDTVQTTEIRRIIRDEVQLKSPLSHAVVSSRPVLHWEPITPGYSFTYTVEVRTDEPDPQLVWQKSGLPPKTSSVQVDVPLSTTPINNYIWAVWVIDKFGNRARSKFKSFQVQ